MVESETIEIQLGRVVSLTKPEYDYVHPQAGT